MYTQSTLQSYDGVSPKHHQCAQDTAPVLHHTLATGGEKKKIYSQFSVWGLLIGHKRHELNW